MVISKIVPAKGSAASKKEWYRQVCQIGLHIRKMLDVQQPQGLELQHAPWIALAWLEPNVDKYTILNLDEIVYITAPTSRVAFVTHYTGRRQEGMSIVGGHFEPLTNIKTGDDFRHPPGGDKSVFPHALQDAGPTIQTCEADTFLFSQGFIRLNNSGTKVCPISVATAFLKSWTWTKPNGHESEDDMLATATRSVTIIESTNTLELNQCINIMKNARKTWFHENISEVRGETRSVPAVGIFQREESQQGVECGGPPGHRKVKSFSVFPKKEPALGVAS
eukprot:13612365-Heterocapsa_arctica.AAC.2